MILPIPYENIFFLVPHKNHLLCNLGRFARLCSSLRFFLKGNVVRTLGDFLCIPTLNTGQLNPMFHTFAEFRLIVNRIVARQSTDWLAANAQFSANGEFFTHCLIRFYATDQFTILEIMS